MKKVKVKSHSPVFAIPWTVACPTPLFMEFSRQGSTGVGCHPLPFPGDLPYPGIKSGSPALQADSLLTEPLGKPTSLPSPGDLPNPGLPHYRQILYHLN